MIRVRNMALSFLATILVWSFAHAATSFGGIILTEVTPRILTPNGDQLNDIVFFKFDNTLTGLPINTAIYDISGAKVGTLRIDSSETALTWDGRDTSGQVLPGGIYIYSIAIGQNEATGSLVLAR